VGKECAGGRGINRGPGSERPPSVGAEDMAHASGRQ